MIRQSCPTTTLNLKGCAMRTNGPPEPRDKENKSKYMYACLHHFRLHSEKTLQSRVHFSLFPRNKGTNFTGRKGVWQRSPPFPPTIAGTPTSPGGPGPEGRLPGPLTAERQRCWSAQRTPKAGQLPHGYPRPRTLPPSAIPTAMDARPARARAARVPGAGPRGRRETRAIGQID